MKTSNCIFNIELTWRNCNWSGKLQVTRLFFLKEIVLAHFQRIFGRSNRDVFLENERKVYAEAATRGALCKKLFLEISWNSQENTSASVSFSIKLQASGTGNVLLKKVFLKRLTGVSEPVVHTSSSQNRCFWNNSQNSQQITCVGVSF